MSVILRISRDESDVDGGGNRQKPPTNTTCQFLHALAGIQSLAQHWQNIRDRETCLYLFKLDLLSTDTIHYSHSEPTSTGLQNLLYLNPDDLEVSFQEIFYRTAEKQVAKHV